MPLPAEEKLEKATRMLGGAHRMLKAKTEELLAASKQLADVRRELQAWQDGTAAKWVEREHRFEQQLAESKQADENVHTIYKTAMESKLRSANDEKVTFQCVVVQGF